MKSSSLLAICLFSVFFSISCGKMLILKDVTNRGADYIFRSNVLYLPHVNAPAVSINCSLPDWYNLTASNTYTYEWKRTIDNEVLDSTNGELVFKTSMKTGVYKCTVKDRKDSKPLPGWDETELKLFRRSTSGRRNPNVALSVTPEEDGNHINYTSDDPHPMKHEMVLTCVCDGCPEVENKFYWVLDGKNVSDDAKRAVTHNGTSLSFGYPFYQDVGVYACVSEANSSTLSWVSITGAPIFAAKGGKGSENKLEGETVSVHNELYGNPITSYVWKRSMDDDDFEKAEIVNVFAVKDKTQEKADDEFAAKNPGLLKRLKFYPTLDAPNGELEITELEKDDRATYIAEATGIGGQKTSFANLVRVKGKLDALWPFLGIVAEVIILVAIIFIYERRRAKKEAELEETPDQKIPLKNDNLRQRKA